MNRAQLDLYLERFQESLDDSNDEEAPYEWKILATLSFRKSLGLSKARQIFYRWLAENRKPVLPHFLNWFAVIEFHRRENNVHIYALIGGSEISYQPGWIDRWRDLSGGNAVISDYRPRAFSKCMPAESQATAYFEVAMDLCGWGLLELDRP